VSPDIVPPTACSGEVPRMMMATTVPVDAGSDAGPGDARTDALVTCNPACGYGTACSNGACAPCGGSGEPCCVTTSGSECSTNFSCARAALASAAIPARRAAMPTRATTRLLEPVWAHRRRRWRHGGELPASVQLTAVRRSALTDGPSASGGSAWTICPPTPTPS
jgi:hypothetical protein